jgi:predicted deacetylase
MDWSAYFKLKKLFDTYDVKPLLGVIPDNQDPRLRQYPHCAFDFWQYIFQQHELGWEIALHGYQHLFVTDHSGLLGINQRSEFAGLPYVEQYQKVRQALNVFSKYDLRTETFMAPAHSYDKTTLEVIKELGFSSVTDGFGLYPYWADGIFYVPQLFARPREMPFGVFTFCIHPNSINNSLLVGIGNFLRRNSENIISFQSCRRFGVRAWTQKPLVPFLRMALKIKRGFRYSKADNYTRRHK